MFSCCIDFFALVVVNKIGVKEVNNLLYIPYSAFVNKLSIFRFDSRLVLLL